MVREDDDFSAKTASVKHAVGEPLDTFSIKELGDRVAQLRTEIERIEAAMARKRASLDAAAAFFKTDPMS